jgi:allophanate hydrolase subunit 2
VLEFGAGASPWNYLALAGGIALPPLLGSRATYAGAGSGRAAGRPLAKGDVLEVFASPDAAPRPAVPAGPPAERLETVTVRAVPGPNDDVFGPAAVEEFFSREWQVEPSSDRRACVLGGPAVAAPPATAISSGTPAGLVQVPPSGRPVVLLADHQTTGGYAAIATVIGPDLPLFARVWPGGKVRFRAVTVDEAHAVWRSMPTDIAAGWPGNGGGRSPGRLVLVLSVPGGSRLVAVEPVPVDG